MKNQFKFCKDKRYYMFAVVAILGIHFYVSNSFLDDVEMNVSSSSNVFMEKLRNLKNLEGTLYITNNQQAMSFMWTRESGLEIKISLSEVYLVPEYVDLDHIDDSYFLLRDAYSTTQDMKNRINTISQNYCRYV